MEFGLKLFVELSCCWLLIFATVVANEDIPATPKQVKNVQKNKGSCSIRDGFLYIKDEKVVLEFTSLSTYLSSSFDEIIVMADCRNHSKNLCHFKLWNLLVRNANSSCKIRQMSMHRYKILMENSLEYKSCLINGIFFPSIHCTQQRGKTTVNQLLNITFKDAQGLFSKQSRITPTKILHKLTKTTSTTGGSTQHPLQAINSSKTAPIVKTQTQNPITPPKIPKENDSGNEKVIIVLAVSLAFALFVIIGLIALVIWRRRPPVTIPINRSGMELTDVKMLK